MRTPLRSASMADLTRAGSLEGDPALEWGIVGHADPVTGGPEPTPAWVECVNGQWLVEVTLPDGEQVQARIGLDGAGAGLGSNIDLDYGARVIVADVGGSGAEWAVVGVLNDATMRAPDTVCGVSTGAAAAVAENEAAVPGPRWRFIKLRPGALMAIETGAGGDYLVHSGGVVELRSATGIHLNGPVRLGVGPSTPPVGATVGPGGTTLPGVPAAPHVPLPRSPSIPVPYGAIVPYLGFQKGVVAADGDVQSHAAKDPFFWAFVAIVYSFPPILALCQAAGIQLPLALHSEHGGFNGPGSQHTAE